jgi:hypothetical protein
MILLVEPKNNSYLASCQTRLFIKTQLKFFTNVQPDIAVRKYWPTGPTKHMKASDKKNRHKTQKMLYQNKPRCFHTE